MRTAVSNLHVPLQLASPAVLQLLQSTGQTLALRHFGSSGNGVHIALTPSVTQLKVTAWCTSRLVLCFKCEDVCHFLFVTIYRWLSCSRARFV